MAVLQGRIHRMQVSSDAGVTWYTVGKLVDATMSLETSEIRTTSRDSAGFEESMPNRMSGTIEATCRYDRGDTNGQGKVIDAAFGQSLLKVRWEPEQGASGSERYESTCWVKPLTQEAPNDDVQSFGFTLQLSGQITRVAVA